MRKRNYGTLVVIALIAITLFPGCHAAPKTYTADLSSPNKRAKVAHLYWKRHNVPPMNSSDNQRVAIVDFSVEFVTTKIVTPFETQATLGLPPITPITAGIELSGISRKRIEYKPDLQQELTDWLYNTFTQTLQDQGMEVISPILVRESAAYKKLKTDAIGEESLGQFLNMVGSDTGRIKAMKTVPATGFLVVKGAKNTDIETVEAEILKEVGAHFALRVHIRVGVYRGRASLEQGTTIWVLTDKTVGSIIAKQSLLSDEDVGQEDEFVAVKGKIFHVNSSKYLAAIRRMFPPFIAMSFEPQQ